MYEWWKNYIGSDVLICPGLSRPLIGFPAFIDPSPNP